MTHVGADYGRLQAALPKFIAQCARGAEGAMERRRREMMRRAAADPDSIDRAEAAARQKDAIPRCVELWIGHLALLDQMAGGAAFGPDLLTAEECRGLAMLRGARDTFWSEHSRCASCGAVNERGKKICSGGCAN